MIAQLKDKTDINSGFSDRFNEFLDRLAWPERGRIPRISKLLKCSETSARRWLVDDVPPKSHVLYQAVRLIDPEIQEPLKVVVFLLFGISQESATVQCPPEVRGNVLRLLMKTMSTNKDLENLPNSKLDLLLETVIQRTLDADLKEPTGDILISSLIDVLAD